MGGYQKYRPPVLFNCLETAVAEASCVPDCPQESIDDRIACYYNRSPFDFFA
jgi:hypothetical protein